MPIQTGSIKATRWTCFCTGLRVVWITALLVVLLLASSCSLYSNNIFNGGTSIVHNAANDYLKANTLPPITIPPHLDSQTIGQILKVPETDILVSSENAEVPPPPRLTIEKNLPRISIQQLDGKRWILMAQPASEAWPLIVNFLKDNKLTVVNTDVSKGTLETDWLTLAIDPHNVNKYLFQLDSGVQPDTTEIHIVNLVRPNDEAKESRQSTQESVDKVRENWMINELVESLTNDTTALGESLLAQKVGSEDKVHLRQQQGELVLAVTLDKQRTYASLSHAFTQDEFILYQQDPEQGIFHINHLQVMDKKKSEGLVSGLIKKLNPFASSERPISDYSLSDIITRLPVQLPQTKKIFPTKDAESSSVKLANVPGYLVVVVEDDVTRQVVYIRDGYGRPLTLSRSKQLLTLIRRQLI
jgi:outer membrane protein assembly factor BamC